MAIWSTGSAVTSTVAVAVAGVARSAASESDTVVCRSADAAGEMSTVAVTPASAVPAGIGVDDVQVRTVEPTSSPQLQPPIAGAAAKVSPDGRVAVRIGSL